MKTTTLLSKHSINGSSYQFTLLLVALAVACLLLAPHVRGQLSPPPDGCYLNFTTAEGCDALNSLTVGSGNTAFGWRSLFSNTTGNFNTGVGGGALALNNADSNTAVGAAALLLNTTGSSNTAVGTDTLVFNDSGGSNTATGYFALMNNTTGSFNTAIGSSALLSNTEGFGNTAVGEGALNQNTTAVQNNAVGRGALGGLQTFGFNNAFGAFALRMNTGIGNTAIGDHAGSALNTGDFNVYIGVNVNGVDGESNTTRISNIGSTPIVGGTNVVIDGTGGIGDQRLGYASSSRRYKQDIKSMDRESETLFALRPVTFRAKGNMHSGNVKHYGLIAEDVEEVDPDLVVYNPEGNPETLRFDSINAMLLNEFLKEHRKVENLEATIAQQRKDFEAAIGQVKAQVQKVSAQLAAASPSGGGLELSKSAPQTVLNNR